MASMSNNQLNVRAVKTMAQPTQKSASNSGGHGTKMQLRKHVPEWDTDFDGAWEMGRDLIREFVTKQNNRNRSISESDAAKFVALDEKALYNTASCTGGNGQIDMMNEETANNFTEVEKDDEANLMKVAAAATTVLLGKNSFDMISSMIAYGNALNLPEVGAFSTSSTAADSGLLMMVNENAFIRSEGYSTPDTLSSWNEVDGNYACAPRRLYEREVSTESINCAGITKIGSNDIETGSDCVDSGCDENNYFAAFEAKFDHNVEALWNDCKQEENPTITTVANAEIQPAQPFWFNYYRNSGGSSSGGDGQPIQGSMYPVEKFSEYLQVNQAASFFGQNANGKNPFVTAQPSSLNSNSSSVGGMGLTTSIWSDNPNNHEDDVSFYANAKLWEKKYAKQATQSMNVSTRVGSNRTKTNRIY